MVTQHLKRSEAGDLIEEIRKAIAQAKLSSHRSPRGVDGDLLLASLDDIFQRRGIEPLRPCTGEAHSNAFIDNCGCCMPRWGLVGSYVKVR